MTETNMAGPHWDFALSFYGRDGVSAACLVLQDRCGVDVNVLLMALYAVAAGKGPVHQDQVARLDRAGALVRELAVLPLRTVRRQMKGADLGPATERVRGKVKAAELAAEQLQMAVLADLVAAWPLGQSQLVGATISAVLGYYGAGPDADITSAAGVLVRAAEVMAHE